MIMRMVLLDWRAMKYYHKRSLLLPIFIFIVGFNQPIIILPFSAIMALSFSINPFAVEEKGALHNFYLTLPIQRKSIVAGRYTLSLFIFLAGMAMGTLIMPLANKISMSKWFIGTKGFLVVLAISYLLYAIFNFFMFPLLFGLGYQKGKFWGFYLPLVLFSLLVGASFGVISLPNKAGLTINFIVWASNNLLVVSGGLVVLATILLILSYRIALRLFYKRDF